MIPHERFPEFGLADNFTVHHHENCRDEEIEGGGLGKSRQRLRKRPAVNPDEINEQPQYHTVDDFVCPLEHKRIQEIVEFADGCEQREQTAELENMGLDLIPACVDETYSAASHEQEKLYPLPGAIILE